MRLDDNKDFVVFIPCYRGKVFLEKAIESILRQTDQHFSVLVINDNPWDEELKHYCEGLRDSLKAQVVLHQENLGTTRTLNHAYNLIKNEEAVVITLADDDRLPPHAVANIRTTFLQSPADFVFGDYLKTEVPQTKPVLFRANSVLNSDGSLNPTKLARRWCLLGTAPMKKYVWTAAGGFDAHLGHAYEDVDFWIRAIEKGARGYYTGQVIYEYIRYPDGRSRTINPYTNYLIRLRNPHFFLKAGLPIRRRSEIIREKMIRGDLAYLRGMRRVGHLNGLNYFIVWIVARLFRAGRTEARKFNRSWIASYLKRFSFLRLKLRTLIR